MGVKSHQLEDFANGELDHLINQDTVLVTLQNGIPFWYFHKHPQFSGHCIRAVDPNANLITKLHIGRIIGCIVYPACEIKEPGVVKHIEGIRFPIGELAFPEITKTSKITSTGLLYIYMYA